MSQEALDRYEATGDEGAYLEAKAFYERALASQPDDPWLNVRYGYLLEIHAQFQIREAVKHYERAIELDPSLDKARYQLINAHGGLREPERSIAVYERWVALSPADLRGYRRLALAHLAGHDYEKARRVVDAGLRLSPDDPRLMESRGDVKSRTSDPDGALADWRRALELDSDNISALYSTAFLLEREGHVDEAISAWQEIIAWCDARGYTLDTQWPKREIQRLRGVTR